MPRVHLLATGGTISGGQQPLDAAGLAALVPDVKQIATVTMEDVTRVGSSRMTPDLQFKLASRINELFAKDPGLAGVVVIGGEDLDGLKARMLLVAALGAGATNEKIQEWVERLAGWR